MSFVRILSLLTLLLKYAYFGKIEILFKEQCFINISENVVEPEKVLTKFD